MIDRQIIFAGRGGGKTYRIMTEIHDLIKAGERSDIVVVFPTMNYLHWWTRAWQERFPFVAMPFYTSMQAMERVRGRRFKYAYVEDIDTDPEGIYNEKICDWLVFSMLEGGTITFTCGINLLNERSHNEHKTPAEIMRETRLKMQRAAAMKRAVEEAMMIDYMLTYINKADDERSK